MGAASPPTVLTPRATCCKTAETLLLGRRARSCHLITIPAPRRRSFITTPWRVEKKLLSAFISGGSYSTAAPILSLRNAKSDCRQLVLLALAVRRVDKWPQAGGLLINRSSLHSSAPSMSTHAPRTDIHLAISNLKSGQCVFIRVRWGREVLVHWRTEWELCGISQQIPRWSILCTQHDAKKTLAPGSRNMSPLCAPCGGSTLLRRAESK